MWERREAAPRHLFLILPAPASEFAKCLLLNNELGLLLLSCIGRHSRQPHFAQEETKAERLGKAPEGRGA